MTTKTKDVWQTVLGMNISHNFTLGPINAESLLKDPKHLSFTLSRYKFATKLLYRCEHIIEIGCGEGIGAFMFLADTSAKVTAIDFDETQIQYATEFILPHTQGRATFVCQDVITTPYSGSPGDGLVSLDVIEHIHPDEEEQFWQICLQCLRPNGIAVFGTPNEHAKTYASARSLQGHINLFGPERLAATLEKYFKHVFLFSMNDEMVHTGFNKLAHYLLALCVR